MSYVTLIITAAAPFLVKWLTDITKNNVFSGDVGTAGVRFACALLSLVVAALTAMSSNGAWQTDPTTLVNTVMMTGYVFLSSTGLHHMFKKQA